MPALDNKRQEAFCLLIVKGGQPDYICYTAAGYQAKTQEVAMSSASSLLRNPKVVARLQELRAPIAAKIEEELQVTTTDVARKLWQMGTYDARKALRVVTTGRGRSATVRAVLVPPDDWPPEIVQACEGFEIKPDGTVKLILAKKTPAIVRVGEHLGMFQGESAGAIPPGGGTTNLQYNDNRTQVFVDKPPNETLDQWRTRIAKERGIVQNGTPKVINGNGAGKS